jgi:hypothetical protein
MKTTQIKASASLIVAGACAACLCLPASPARGQAAGATDEAAAEATPGTPPEDEKVLPAPRLPEPEGAKRMPEPDRVWIDVENRQVLIDGYVSLREGYLEMFACLVGTKEHESIVAAETRAATVHAALLAVGAVEGHPVQYKPEFAPPAGTKIDIEVRWLDPQGQWQSARAQEWVRDMSTEKEMTHPWVFAGSSFWTDETNGKKYYTAEQGDFICVSNFQSATLDVPIESSQANDGLLFKAFTERIPELGTRVRLVLTPVLEVDEASTRDAQEQGSEDASE